MSRGIPRPDQNETGSLEKHNDMRPARSGSSMFRPGIVYGMRSTFRRRHVAEPERGSFGTQPNRIRHTVFCRG